jgi:hypothetical protein
VSKFCSQLRGGDSKASCDRFTGQRCAAAARVRKSGGNGQFGIFGQRRDELRDFSAAGECGFGHLKFSETRPRLSECGSGATRGVRYGFHGRLEWGRMGVWARTLPAIIKGMVVHSKGWYAPLSAQRLAHLPA